VCETEALLPVEFDLITPEGDSPPSKVMVQVMSGNVIFGSAFADGEKTTEPGVLRIKGTIQAPKSAGKFAIRAEVLQMTAYRRGRGSPGQSHQSVVHSPLIPVTVKKRKP
jgi:hypothetical protein